MKSSNRSPLQGKRAVVIGGTHGMGLATTRRLLETGANVLVTGSREQNVAAARTELAGIADLSRFRVQRSDVSRGEDIEELARTTSATFERLDALFVFAAVAEFAPVEDVTEQGFDRQFAINTKGTFFTLQRLAPLVREGGSITLTTVTPATASPAMGVYMATKAAIRALAQVLAAELLARRVRVNTLAPGFIDTPTLGVAGLTPEERQAFREVGDRVTPMRRHGTPDEVARAALFLAFDATFSTGIELVVDGGLSTVDAPPA